MQYYLIKGFCLYVSNTIYEQIYLKGDTMIMRGLDHFIKMMAYERGIHLNSVQVYAIKQILLHTDMWNEGIYALESYILKMSGNEYESGMVKFPFRRP